MSVTARIKQKSLFKKKMNLEDIIKFTGLSYGVCDENYRLNKDDIGEHTLSYRIDREIFKIKMIINK